MYAEEIKRFRKQLRSDKQFRKMEKFFERISSEIATVALYEEIQTLHKMRSSRSLERTNKGFLDKVVEASIQDQSYRSRLAEIQMECARALSKYETMVDDLVVYMGIQHLEALKTFFSAKTERVEFLHNLCKDNQRFLREIASVGEAAKTIISDIDKAGFMYKNLIEAVKIVHERKA